METRIVRSWGVAATALALGLGPSVCEARGATYHWGSIETVLYRRLVRPERTSPEEGIAKLRKELEKAAEAHRAAPPGIHAFLGLLLLESGAVAEAREEFAMEKTIFPESGLLMDRLIQKLGEVPKP